MRWSQGFIPTLREDPANVEAASHRLLIRAGYIRQLTAGVYSLLPLAQRIRLKLIEIIREELNKMGAQEFLLSALQPIELWEESGRVNSVADVMFRFKDRKGSHLALGVTHEEVFTSIARSHITSYRQLPQIWYQFQTKFRDEARPRAGLLRVREFTMKDSYSFDLDETGLDKSFQLHHDTYKRIFRRCGVNATPVQAHSGSMGGSASIEFMAITDAGEDTIVLCSKCQYAANIERAESSYAPLENGYKGEQSSLTEFATPGIRTIDALAKFKEGAPASRQIKTLVYLADSKIALALVLGDQELNEAKLQSALQCKALRQAVEAEIVEALGAHPGSLGACGIKSAPDGKVSAIVADVRLKGRENMVTGANKDDVHLRGVSMERDIIPDRWHDLHTVKSGESCTSCGGTLELVNGLELGHIFKLGTFYSKTMDAGYLDNEGNRNPLFMGSYGIGVERLLAAAAELTHDAQGLSWPVALAPFHVVILAANSKDKKQIETAERIYDELKGCGFDCLLDDRDERAGVKFNDADLIGVPFRITVGRRAADGYVELTRRKDKRTADFAIADISAAMEAEITAAVS